MTQEPTLLGDRYALGDVIGRGGMAEVRRAHDTRLGRDVAIKQLRVDLAGDPMFQARFKRESQAAAGLNHPNIVSVYDTGVRNDDGVEIPYIVMELVEGHTLREILRDGRRIRPERAFELTQGVLDALAYSHKAGIVHRDIKPANVMLTNGGLVKVMDFGIARAVADTSATMTQTAAVIGTAQYLSPEQARGEHVDARSDVYSAGCLLYELLTGRPPFIGDSPVSVAYQHVREVPVPPSQVDGGDPQITPAMDAICLKALAKDPADRFQSAQEMRADIGRLLDGSQVDARIPAAFLGGAAAADLGTATQLLPPIGGPTTAADQPPVGLVMPSRPAEPEPATATAVSRRRGTNPFVVAMLVLLALAVIAGSVLAWLWFDGQNKQQQATQVPVPAVIGMNAEAAKSTLSNAGLNATVEETRGANDSTINTVVKQNPVKDAKVPTGSTVTLTINIGPDKILVPDVTGKSKADAQKALTDAGFKNVTTQAASNEPANARKDTVTSQNPPAGTAATADTAIALSIASGQFAMPNLRGMTSEAAQAELTKLGFGGTITVQEVYDAANPAGTVTGQSPAQGQPVAKDGAVTINVARTPPTTAPPSTPPPSSAPPSTQAPSTPAQSPTPSPSSTK